MAFNTLADNQMVSYAEANTSSFTLKSGQVNPNTNQVMTKDMANAMYNLAPTAGSNGIIGTQLMQKSFWSTGVVYYLHYVSYSGFATETEPCGFNSDMNYLCSADYIININSILYQDINLTNVFVGQNYYYEYSHTTESIYKSIRISNSGVVTALINCSGTDTTPPSTPINVYVNQIGANDASIHWDASTDNVAVNSYQVHRTTGGANGLYTLMGTVATSPFTDSGLSGNVEYWYKIRAIDSSNNLSAFSIEAYLYMLT